MSDAEITTEKIANHLVHYFEEPEDSIGYEHITYDLIEEVKEMHLDFSCEKVKIFSKQGEIIYSTDPADIGIFNTKDYFKPVVNQGVSFTKIVSKNSKTAEDRIVPVDVVETYVPLVFGDKIAGAVEVYFDVTQHRENIDQLINTSTFIGIAVTVILLIAVFITLYRLNKNMIAREHAERELATHSDKLKERVNEQTAELREANILLKEDIEKREQTEKALRESEEKYHGLIQSASDGIFVIDADSGMIIDVNRKGLDLLGKSADKIIGMHNSKMHPADEMEKYIQLFKRFASYITPPDIAYHVLHKDGYRIPVEISTSVMELGGRKIIQGIFRDIRERLKMEEEIQKAQRLESAGILAGGIAHDFNNLLTAILGNISLAKIYVEPNDKVYARLLETEKATIRAKALTQQLLTFAKGGLPVTKTVDLSNTIVESAEFVLHGSTLKCECKVSDDLWLVDADLGQINQVIHNLVINAAQVMPNGGTCRLVAENILIHESDTIPLIAGKYVKISVHDEGEGIQPENLGKIFDPYFTTKKTGTGLGLPSAYSIIKKHEGLLTVNSEIGEGTIFHIYLKASKQTALPEKKDDVLAKLSKGEGTILLMDDEEFVREIASNLLQHLGFSVETANEGGEALELFKKSLAQGERFVAVITDLTVPGGMGGKEMVKEIKKLDQSAKVIVSSGYANDPILANYKAYGFDGRVSKPYKIEELAETLRHVLDTIR